MSTQNVSWKNTQTAKQYLQSVQRIYEREPVVQISLQLIVSIFAVAFFTFAAIRPTLGTISTLLKKIDDQKKVDQQLNTKIVQLNQAQQELQSWQNDIPLITQAIPTNYDFVGFIQRLEILANQNNVRISNIDFQGMPVIGRRSSIADQQKGAKTTTTNNFITFTFIIKGDRPQIMAYVSSLEKLDRAVAVTKLTVNKPQTSIPGDPPLVANGKGTIYYLATQTP